jgi:glutathione peroxidase-family protein
MGELSSLNKLLSSEKPKEEVNVGSNDENPSFKLIKWKVDKYKDKVFEILDMNSEQFESTQNDEVITENKIYSSNL